MKRFMSIKDTATYSGLSQFYIRNRCKNGTIPHRMMGKKYMVDYEAFIEREHKLAVQSIATLSAPSGGKFNGFGKEKAAKEWQFFL